MANRIEQPQLFDDNLAPTLDESDLDATAPTVEGRVVSGDRLVSERYAYERLAVSRSTLRTIAELRPVHIGRSVRYRLSDLEAYIKRLA